MDMRQFCIVPILGIAKKFFTVTCSPALEPIQSLYFGYLELILWGQRNCSMKQTTHLHLEPRLRLYTYIPIPPLPHIVHVIGKSIYSCVNDLSHTLLHILPRLSVYSL